MTASARRPGYVRSGFVLAMALRLLTASLVIVIPLFAIDVLDATASQAGIFVVMLWVGNAVGVVLAVTLVRNQSASSLSGFVAFALSMVFLALGVSPPWLFTLAAGIGMGLPQPFLSAMMHLDSDPGAPFSGLGLYSTALGIGLVLGPFLAYGMLSLYGFEGVFSSLAAVCLLGMGGAAAGHRILAGRPRTPPVSPLEWLAALRNVAFRRPFVVNLLYSLLLPIFLSYGAIYAEGRFGFTPTEALLLFTAVFAISTLTRFAAVRVATRLGEMLLVSVILLLCSALSLGIATAWPLFVLGMLLFSLPHALIFPIATYYAFTSVSGERVMNASYAFQASSGVAELLSPAGAVVLIPLIGVQGLFLAGAVLAAGALVATVSSPWIRT